MAYNVLADNPRIDFSICTPYLLVHILHVATAHSLQALQRVEQRVPLEAARATAAGHTLLHIVSFQDSDQNTPLHYLAGARAINEDAIQLLREVPEGEMVWREVKNWYGDTPEEIWEQNCRVRTRKDNWYGGTTHKVAKMPMLRV
ncbi:hypothetical protein N7451_000561 [Penicillium sp. IBT 35674x]|nr:hypothetical protein N7451_000561 [Penicillium sp. IBT 35674x]